MRRVMISLTAAACLAGTAHAYPNGTPYYVTDLVPACASCHAILDAAVMPEALPEAVAAELAKNKHLGAIGAGAFPLYSELSPAQKASLAVEVEALDREASVELSAPASAKAGAEVEVIVRYAGGNGPVVGVMLVDRAHRNQARPVQSGGWKILGVRAQTSDGKDASEWFARRGEPKTSDLNFVLLPAARSPGGPAPAGTVTFRLRAPADPGSHPLTAVFLYGTENTDRAGFFQRPSGRTNFSKTAAVAVGN